MGTGQRRGGNKRAEGLEHFEFFFPFPTQTQGDDETQQLQKALLDYMEENTETDPSLLVSLCYTTTLNILILINFEIIFLEGIDA